MSFSFVVSTSLLLHAGDDGCRPFLTLGRCLPYKKPPYPIIYIVHIQSISYYAPSLKGLSRRRRLVHHLCLLLAKSLRDPLAARHELLYASCHAAGLALDQRFGGEVVHARVEAVGYEVGEHLWVRSVTWPGAQSKLGIARRR